MITVDYDQEMTMISINQYFSFQKMEKIMHNMARVL